VKVEPASVRKIYFAFLERTAGTSFRSDDRTAAADARDVLSGAGRRPGRLFR